MARTIRIGRTTVCVGDGRCQTMLHDGSTVDAEPHDTDEYREKATALGYGRDTGRMCVEHELTHSLLCHAIGLSESPVMRAVAIDGPDSVLLGYEEDAVLAVQKFVATAGIDLVSVLARRFGDGEELDRWRAEECQEGLAPPGAKGKEGGEDPSGQAEDRREEVRHYG